jgi:predicted dienelactone hydrolase
MTSRAVVIAGCLIVTTAACSSGSGTTSSAASTTRPSSTTLPAAEAAAAYSKLGPFPVGVTMLHLEGGVNVEVWYPAIAGTRGVVTYDVRDRVPPAVKSLLTADIPATYTIAAGRDTDVATGKFPLVLFSHGFSGFREQSSFLTSHLASWGMIVVAPDHWSRDLFHVLGRVIGQAGSDRDDVDDLRLARELMEDANTDTTSRFANRVDLTRIATVGHSAGGATALRMAADPKIDGYVSLASGARLQRPGAAVTRLPQPAKPSLFMAGTSDEIVQETVTKDAFEHAPAPSSLWLLERVGHNGFDDLCTLGNGQGIIGIAEASGLGAFLDAQPRFRRLGQDGCLAPDAPVAQTFPIVRHAVTAWLRALFGTDPTPVGLGPEVDDEYAVPVHVTNKT